MPQPPARALSRRYAYNYRMGIGYEGTYGALPGAVTVGISEQNQRGFYQRWAECMDARTWTDLATAGVGTQAAGKRAIRSNLMQLGVGGAMAIDQTHDRERTIEHLLLIREVEEFLYTEAELLDTRLFTEWLALLTEDVRYWMPMRRNVKFGEQERENTREQQDMNWFDEGKTTLTQRVQQILTGVHWAEEPLSRVCHMVSNVRVAKVALPEVTVTCRFLVYRNRLQDETDFFVGKREDVLRQVDGQWKIARRKILLDQNVLLAKNLTLFF